MTYGDRMGMANNNDRNNDYYNKDKKYNKY